MCLIAFAIGTHPALPLLLASNRDEFFERPTEPLHRWPGMPGVWAGRDRRDGGTWLGLADNGRVAWLTNVRSAHARQGRRSRGELVTRWLQGDASVDSFAAALDPAAYGGFNLVLGELQTQRWAWLCNRDPAQPHQDTASLLHLSRLSPGLYGLSNAVLDTPWHKTQRLKQALQGALPAAAPHPSAWVAPATDGWMQPLQAALADDQPAPRAAWPTTGVDAEAERLLSSPFVRMPGRGYGTRSSLILRVQRKPGGQHLADLHEWTHSPQGWATQARSHHHLVF